MSDAPVQGGPRCPRCGTALRLSHVEYAGRGLEAPVRRCPGCGEVIRGGPRPRRAPDPTRSRRRHAPVDEGPPANPVLDPEVARRLLGSSETG